MNKFLAEKNLTETLFLRRLTLADQVRFYETCCYEPRMSGMLYDVGLEEPCMFGFDEDDPHLVPRDMRHADNTDHGSQGHQYEADPEWVKVAPMKLQVIRN